MHNRFRSNKYVTIIIILLLFIGIGFAYLNKSLSINGTANIGGSTWNVHLENLQVSSGSVSLSSGNTAASIDPEDPTVINYSITLDLPGEYYEFTVDAVNDGTISAKIGEIISTINDEEIDDLPSYLDYSITYLDGTPIEENQVLLPNATETYKVRIEFKKNIDESDLPEDSVTMSCVFSIKYVQADSESTTTTYTVIHQYQTLNNSYKEEVQEMTGTLNTTVTPSINNREGFVSPETKTVTLRNNDVTITYVYNRVQCELTLLTPEYITTDTPSGTYLYGTEITLTAIDRVGFEFTNWTNDETNEEITFTITGDTTIGPVYNET